MKHSQLQLTHAFMFSLAACSIPGALVAVVATLGAALGWGGLTFHSPAYYAILAVAAWCPVSKLVAWRFWRREVETCLTCIPAKSIGRRWSAMASVVNSPAPDERMTEG